MGSTGVVQPISDNTPRMGVGAQIVNIFIAPSKTFEDIKKHGAGWAAVVVAWVLIALSMVAMAYVIQVKIGYDTVAENKIRRMPKFQQVLDRMPEERRAQILEQQPTSAQRTAYGGGILVGVIVLVVAALQMATFNFGFATKLKFKACIAIVMLSSLPLILKHLLAIVSIYAGLDPGGFNIDSPVASNLGALFDVATHPYLATLGQFVDLFAFWSLALSALGFAIVGGVKFSKALIPVVGWYALFVLGLFGFLAAFLL